MLDTIGWIATAIFSISYFVHKPGPMRLIQGLASVCWIVYGVLLHARPIIGANIIVASLAVYSAWRTTRLEVA